MESLSYLSTLSSFYNNEHFRSLVARHGLVSACKTVYCRAVRYGDGKPRGFSPAECRALLTVIRSANEAAEGSVQ